MARLLVVQGERVVPSVRKAPIVTKSSQLASRVSASVLENVNCYSDAFGGMSAKD